MAYAQDAEDLIVTLREDTYFNYQDAADALGWPRSKFNNVLHKLRKDHFLGLTVTYVGPGNRDKPLEVIDARKEHEMDADGQLNYLRAAATVMRMVRTLNSNAAFQHELVANGVPPKLARALRKWAKITVGAEELSPLEDIEEFLALMLEETV